MKVLWLNGKYISVTDEVYEVYTKGNRKNKYFIDDLKKEKIIVNQDEEKVRFIPSREDSYERLTCECEKEFADLSECTEDEAMKNLMIEKVREALGILSETETKIVYGLFFEGKTGKLIAKDLNVSEMAISKRKRTILKKLRKHLEKEKFFNF